MTVQMRLLMYQVVRQPMAQPMALLVFDIGNARVNDYPTHYPLLLTCTSLGAMLT